MNSTLNTITEIRKNGGNVGIYTYYSEDGLLSVFVSETSDSINNVQFLEGEFGVINSYSDIIPMMNKKGEFIIQHNDDKSFSINDDGELIFEIEE